MTAIVAISHLSGYFDACASVIADCPLGYGHRNSYRYLQLQPRGHHIYAALLIVTAATGRVLSNAF